MGWSESRTFSITPGMLALDVLTHSITQHGSTLQTILWGILTEELVGGQALSSLCRSDPKAYKVKRLSKSLLGIVLRLQAGTAFKGRNREQKDSERALLPYVE